MATHYDITMDNDVAMHAHKITMGSDVTRDIHCYVIMHTDVAVNLCYVFSALWLIVLFIIW